MKIDRKKLLLAGWLWMMFTAALQGEPGIRIIEWKQRWPWNGMVDITYSIECAEKNYNGTPVDIRVSFSGYDRDLARPIEMKTFTGDGADKPVRTGGPYKITWNGGKDHPDFHSSAFQITAEAVTQPMKIPEWSEAGKYLVIDLSGGADAEKYFYHFSETGPDLSQDACRTRELWLRRIPAGEFTMGSSWDEQGHWEDETPHKVKLTQAFYMGVFEVTQQQWNLVMGDNPSCNKGVDRPVEQVSYEDIRGFGGTAGGGWPHVGYKVDAGSFMGILQKKTGLMLDLPTEAQWEYACRAGTTTSLNSGKDLNSGPDLDPEMELEPGMDPNGDGACTNMDEVGRYYGNRGEEATARVGSYLPNQWGLYDMHGNVDELCLDWSGNLGTEAVEDPKGALNGTYRMLRGGNWNSFDIHCRSACRILGIIPSGKWEYTGFRLACLSPEAVPPVPPEPDPDPDPNPDSETKPAGKYLVIDLSGGTTAEKYPYHISEAEPELSQDTCRTTELWLRRIPAGTFIMGSPKSERGRWDDEVQHRVILTKDFYVGIFEVTQKQWNLVMGTDPSQHKGADRPVENVSYDDIRGGGGTAGAGWPAAGHAVDAESFMGRLQKKTGLVLDLPTEAQWEYACRAGTTTALNSEKNLDSGVNLSGDGVCPNMNEVGRYKYNQTDGRGKYVEHARVGSYLPNKWGLYDMHGNVFEWCLDWYGGMGQVLEVVTDPKGPQNKEYRVLRGGSWDYNVVFCRSACRNSSSPSGASNNRGFRLACMSAVR